MSFDLYFCGVQPSAKSLKEYFDRSSPFQTIRLDEGGVRFDYLNEATGVYCNFSYSPLGARNEAGRCSGSTLSYNLNYNRPTFFAHETMPLVQEFCENFNLLVEDAQEDTIERAEARRLVDSWRLHNAQAVGALREQGVNLRYLMEKKAEEWWRYTHIQKQIESSLVEYIFVPDVLIVESPQKKLFRMIVWPGIAQLFPPCDYVFIAREKKRSFELIPQEESGLVPYDVVLETIKPSLNSYDTAEGPIKYLNSGNELELTTAIRDFDLIPVDFAKHTRVSPDGFHDVELRTEDEAFQTSIPC